VSDLRLEIRAATKAKAEVIYYDAQNNPVLTHLASLAGIHERQKAAKLLQPKLHDKGVEMTPEQVEQELEAKWLEHLKNEEKRKQDEEARKAEADARRAAEQASAEDPDGREIRVLNDTSAEMKAEAKKLLHNKALVSKITRDIEKLGIAGEEDLSLTIYLLGTSRKLEKPLSSIVKGPTSSGKSYIVEKVADLFPPESVIRATQMTPQALFHLPKGVLRHAFIVAGERRRDSTDEAAEATRPLREMRATGRLSKLMAVKEGNEIVTRLIEQEGPIAFIETTSLNEVFAEDENRGVDLFTDEQQEQTRKVIDKAAQRRSGQAAAVDTEAICRLHQTLQRLLRRVEVVIPFAPKLAKKFPSQRVEARRAFPHLLSLIEASALLHQYQRERDPYGRVVATSYDYSQARGLLADTMRRSLGGGISQQAERFYKRLWEWFKTNTFSSTEAKAKEDAARSAVYGWLSELYQAGAIKQMEESRGRSAAKWSLPGEELYAGKSVLPDEDEIFRA
jgi:hypothetical protein